jgi:outer membrane autotransporter protein
VQYAWDATGQAGLAIGYANSKDKFNDGRGETQAKTTSVQGFAAAGAKIRFAAIGGYGWTNLDTDRNLPSLGLTASSSPDASVWGLAGRVSAPFHVGSDMTLSPYGQLDGQWAHVDSYIETGAGAVGLIVPKHHYDTSALELGAAFSMPFSSGFDTVWSARLQAGWRHALKDGEDTLPLAFIGSPVGFLQEVAGAGRNAAHLDASITAAVGQRWTASVGYRGLIGEDGNVNGIELRFRYAL